MPANAKMTLFCLIAYSALPARGMRVVVTTLIPRAGNATKNAMVVHTMVV